MDYCRLVHSILYNVHKYKSQNMFHLPCVQKYLSFKEKQSEHKRRRNKKGKGKKRSKKEREIRKSKLKEKRRWVPPPRPPPELIEMPPEVKRLYEILREENIR